LALVKQGDLTEDYAGADNVEDDLLAGPARRADLGTAAPDRHQCVAGLALFEDAAIARDSLDLGEPQKPVEPLPDMQHNIQC